jgi:hypothetical protein
MSKAIEVQAARSQESLEWSGADHWMDGFETVAEAKAKAKHYLTEEYRRVSESSERLGYARVMVDGVCVADYFPAQAFEVKRGSGLKRVLGK